MSDLTLVCSTCKGKGEYPVQSTRGPLETDTLICPSCDGTGLDQLGAKAIADYQSHITAYLSESLRAKVIEAGAPAIRRMWVDYDLGPTEPFTPEEIELSEAVASQTLDAILDCLGENQEEWVKGAGRLVLTTDSTYEALLAVLREDR